MELDGFSRCIQAFPHYAGLTQSGVLVVGLKKVHENTHELI